MFIDYSINCLCAVDCVVLVVEFESEQYIGTELSEFVEVIIILSRGLSIVPISIMATITTKKSAKGEEYINNITQCIN